jgi:hypothetical protein
MGERGKDNIKRPQVRVIEGGRAGLERELLWLIALGGDANRIEELTRTLEAASNHVLQLIESRIESSAQTMGTSIEVDTSDAAKPVG